ncbi:MAG: hypothetical protein KBD24_00930 [Candidatus Pacebacteria bacterium]|nr:hypothetical protein [Candidatus Paceibacterota bacterium]
MGHVKIISYANKLEMYEYDRDILVLKGRGKPIKCESATSHGDEDMGAGGKDILQKRKLGKRPDNARRASMAFRRIVASNLGETSSPILVTLTYRDNFTNLGLAYQHFSAFTRTLRSKYGKEFRYICVPEFQKRGAVHFHALVWGLPEEVVLQERNTRALAGLWAKGFVFLKQTDGNERLSRYLSKYMAKAFTDPRLKNQKSYVASKNILRPLIQSGSFLIEEVLAQFRVTEPAIFDQSFTTSWLGNGRYRVFNTHDID